MRVDPKTGQIVSKSDDVRAFVQSGRHQDALRIASTFKLGLTKDEQAVLRRAHEATSFPDFYRQLGKDPSRLIAAGVELLTSKYA